MHSRTHVRNLVNRVYMFGYRCHSIFSVSDSSITLLFGVVAHDWVNRRKAAETSNDLCTPSTYNRRWCGVGVSREERIVVVHLFSNSAEQQSKSCDYTVHNSATFTFILSFSSCFFCLFQNAWIVVTLGVLCNVYILQEHACVRGGGKERRTCDV